MELAKIREIPLYRSLVTLGAVALVAGCGGSKPRVPGEFRDGMRIQYFHPRAGSDVYTEVVQQCDEQTLLETTLDIKSKDKNPKLVYTTVVTTTAVSNSPDCADGKLTPDDFSGENSPTPTTPTGATANV